MKINALLPTALAALAYFDFVVAISFPAPTGKYQTSLTTMQLTDPKRLDPFAPSRKQRSIMISVFQPIDSADCQLTTAPYMDNVTATFQDTIYGPAGIPAGTFGSLELSVCKSFRSKHPRKLNEFPLVLFSPGLGTNRLFYSALAQQVASSGYVVITIDHPYDVDIVSFPDGTSIEATDIETDEEILLAVKTRVQDMSFVLDQISGCNPSRALLSKLTTKIQTSRVGVFGHSLGGAAAAEALLTDNRLVGAANMDGSMFGKILTKGTKKPVLLFSHEGKDLSTDPSWKSAWGKLTGWKRLLTLADSAHYTFSDLPLLVKVLGIAEALPEEIVGMFGTIDGGRSSKIITTYIASFFDFVLRGKKNASLDGPQKKYPEISFPSTK